MLGSAGVMGLFCLQLTAAQAQSGGNFLNLSFSGDGKTPSSLELHSNADRNLSKAAFAASGSETGDAG